MLAESLEMSESRAIVHRLGDGRMNARQPIQAILPLYRGQLSPVEPPRFAHPAEAQLAQVFSFYGIRWAYEPTTFALTWHANGSPSEMFTPDFYLPDHHLYVELTTMRQRLVTRKNRKVRLLTEVYPNARIKLVYRRDFLRLVQTFRRAITSPTNAGMGTILWSDDEIRTRAAEIAEEIADTCQPFTANPVLLAFGRGAGRWQRDLQRALRELGIDAPLDQMRLAHARLPQGLAHVRICRSPRLGLADRPVVLVTDVVSTGMSLRYVQDWLVRRGVTIVHTSALLDRISARLVDVRVDTSAFIAPHDLLAGYGLALQAAFADQPWIGAVHAVNPEVPLI